MLNLLEKNTLMNVSFERRPQRDVMEVNSKKCRTRTYWFISITLITRLDILFPLVFFQINLNHSQTNYMRQERPKKNIQKARTSGTLIQACQK